MICIAQTKKQVFHFTDYGHTKVKSLILCSPNSNPNPKYLFGMWIWRLSFFVEIMNMDRRLTVSKWVLLVWPKIPQMLQNLSAQFVCPSPKVLDFNEKRLHWASVVRVSLHLFISVKEAIHSSSFKNNYDVFCWPGKFL